MGYQILEYRYGEITPSVICCPPLQESILRSAIDYFQGQHSSRLIQTHDTEHLVKYILENFIVVFIEDDYLLVLDVVEPWYSPKEVLQEVLLYRYGGGNTSLARVAEVMDSIARGTGCASIEVGTMAAIGRHEALARLYHQQGFVTDFISLRKNTHGCSKENSQEGHPSYRAGSVRGSQRTQNRYVRPRGCCP